jgi:hypothetical protein
MGLFSSPSPPQPATVPSDEIIPLHFWNTALCMRGTVLDISLKFDDVLDFTKLRSGLEELLNVGSWRQLGARLRLNVCVSKMLPRLYADTRKSDRGMESCSTMYQRSLMPQDRASS